MGIGIGGGGGNIVAEEEEEEGRLIVVARAQRERWTLSENEANAESVCT